MCRRQKLPTSVTLDGSTDPKGPTRGHPMTKPYLKTKTPGGPMSESSFFVKVRTSRVGHSWDLSIRRFNNPRSSGPTL